MLVTSKKHLLELLPVSITNTKNILKLFTIASGNKLKIYYQDNFMTFIYEDQFIKASSREYISNSTKTKYINMKNITLKESNVTFDISYYKYIWLVKSDFQIIQCKVEDYRTIVDLCKTHNTSNFLKQFNSMEDAIRFIISSNQTSFRHLTHKEFGNNSGELCLRDCGFLKKGMIIKTNTYFFSYRNPLDVLTSNGYYYFQNENLSCDLSLITLEQLESFKENRHSCGKQTTYCSKGCSSGDCNSVSANTIEKNRKEILIKLWKEIYE